MIGSPKQRNNRRYLDDAIETESNPGVTDSASNPTRIDLPSLRAASASRLEIETSTRSITILKPAHQPSANCVLRDLFLPKLSNASDYEFKSHTRRVARSRAFQMAQLFALTRHIKIRGSKF
jgi:hypothetical protein